MKSLTLTIAILLLIINVSIGQEIEKITDSNEGVFWGYSTKDKSKVIAFETGTGTFCRWSENKRHSCVDFILYTLGDKIVISHNYKFLISMKIVQLGIYIDEENGYKLYKLSDDTRNANDLISWANSSYISSGKNAANVENEIKQKSDNNPPLIRSKNDFFIDKSINISTLQGIYFASDFINNLTHTIAINENDEGVYLLNNFAGENEGMKDITAKKINDDIVIKVEENSLRLSHDRDNVYGLDALFFFKIADKVNSTTIDKLNLARRKVFEYYKENN